MTIALIIIAGLTGLASTGSAVAKLTKNADVIANLEHVGVPARQIPVLAALELAGALGLLIGIWIPGLGIAAATGLVFYFAGAVGAHLKVKDGLKDYAPAFVLFLVSAVTLALEVKRLK